MSRIVMLMVVMVAVPVCAALNFDNGSNEQVEPCPATCTTDHFFSDGAWTALVFARIENFSSDQRSLITRDVSGSRKFYWRVQTDGTIRLNNSDDVDCDGVATTPVIDSTESIATDTWYLFAASMDGTEVGSDTTMYVFNMAGTAVVDGTTGSSDSECTEQLAPVVICGSGFPTNDEMDGDCAYAAYFSQELSRQQILEYLWNPRAAAAKFKTTDTDDFFLPLFDASLSTHPDWTGNDNDGSTVGTLTDATNPPTGTN